MFSEILCQTDIILIQLPIVLVIVGVGGDEWIISSP